MIYTKRQKAYRILQYAQYLAETRVKGWETRSRLEEIQFFDGYAEPGYGSGADDELIAIGDWNTINRSDREKGERVDISTLPKQLAESFERIGVEIEWSDEWASCCNCGKLVRTSGDSYSWAPSFVENDGELTCCECATEDDDSIASLLESYEGNPNNALTLDVDPTSHGYTCLFDRCENGWHRGMDASPKVIAKELHARGVGRFLFKIEENSQFYTTFGVYVHDEEWNDDLKTIATDGPSVSAALERGLLEASAKMDALKGEGVCVATVNADGTADARLVSQQEFIEGNAFKKE